MCNSYLTGLQGNSYSSSKCPEHLHCHNSFFKPRFKFCHMHTDHTPPPPTTTPPPPPTTPPPPVSCPPLTSPNNGRVVVGSPNIGATAFYLCTTGYTRVGSVSRRCQSNGQWTGSPPTCQAPGECLYSCNEVNFIFLFLFQCNVPVSLTLLMEE